MKKRNVICWSKGFTPKWVTGHQRKWGLGKPQPGSCFILFFKKRIIYLTVPGLICGVQDVQFGRWILSCSVWDLVPWVEMEPGRLHRELKSLSHRTTGEVLTTSLPPVWCQTHVFCGYVMDGWGRWLLGSHHLSGRTFCLWCLIRPWRQHPLLLIGEHSMDWKKN